MSRSSRNEAEGPRDGCGLDVAAYALGALDRAEAEAFAAHLETCTVCREELAEFEVVVTSLPMTVHQHAAPEALRRRVMDVVHDEARARTAAPAPPARRAARRSWLAVPRPAMALGAALAVVALAVLGGLELGRGGPTRPRAHVYAAQVSGVAGSAEVKVTGGHAELVVRNLTAPPAGKIYEVWLARPHKPLQPTSALFSVTLEGDGDVAVPGNLRGVTAVMVTPEPTGGSRVPTAPPVIRAQLT